MKKINIILQRIIMKTINTLLFLVCITLATSCSKDSEDEFKETNGNDVKKKYLTSIKVIDDSNLDEGKIQPLVMMLMEN